LVLSTFGSSCFNDNGFRPFVISDEYVRMPIFFLIRARFVCTVLCAFLMMIQILKGKNKRSPFF
jgi:hypothetical protein